MIARITFDTSRIRTKLKTLPHFVRKEGFPIAAGEATQEILETTSQGFSPKGDVFVDYTDPYKKRKEKETGSSSPVNLRLKNEMLNSLHYRPSEQLLTVADDQLPKTKGVSHKRRFLVASKAMALRIVPALQTRLQQYLR